MEKNYATVLESYLIAEEGLGMDILKALGRGVGSLLKKIAIFLGVTIGFCGLLVIASERTAKRVQQRLANPTPEEKLSRENYLSTWVPKIQEFQESVQKDIDKLDKTTDIKKYLYVGKPVSDNLDPRVGYGAYLVALEYENIQYPDADGDDEPDPEKAKDFFEKMKFLKPLVQKWKSEAAKFSPYFEICAGFDENEDYPEFWIVLDCKWLDRDGIIKPGLPKFEDK